MKKITIILKIVILILTVTACKEQNTAKKEQVPKVQVKITHISNGYLPDNIELTGKTVYLGKYSVVAPIGGYVIEAGSEKGDRVIKGEKLFSIQSTEAFRLKKTDSSSKNIGVVNVYAPTDGFITALNIIQQPVYLDQGSEMCTITGTGDLKVQTAVPFEYQEYTQIGKKCKIILPDSTQIQATFSKILTQMNEASQTVEILASINSGMFIPENMIVRVLVDKTPGHTSQLVPKNCLMSDALVTNFWVMKLINDSTAIRVPVVVGNQTHKQVEIIKPEFSKNDRIINQGAYGLEDTSFVEIIRK